MYSLDDQIFVNFMVFEAPLKIILKGLANYDVCMHIKYYATLITQ